MAATDMKTVPFKKPEDLTAEDLPPANKKPRLSSAPLSVQVASRSSDAAASYEAQIDLTEDDEGNVFGVKEVTTSCQAQQSITFKGKTLSSEVSETVTCVKEIAEPQEVEVAGPSKEETTQPQATASTSQQEPAEEEEDKFYDIPEEEDDRPPSPPSFTPETPDDIREALKGLDPPPRNTDLTVQELQEILSREKEYANKFKDWWNKVPSPSYPTLNYVVLAKDTIDPDIRWE